MTRIIIIIFYFYSTVASAQTVGLVLSGGGAPGLAHVGVIKAFEENGIPIDYIVGTSAGAVVGSLYAAGLSPFEMEALITSDKFYKMATGAVEDGFHYYLKSARVDASWVSLRFDKNVNISNILPSTLTNSDLLDFEFLKSFTAVSAKVDYNFDSLMIPFRCVASDVESKKSVIFKDGHVNEAVRASLTYPGYIRPIKVDDKLLFDGGLYNNFPADVMYNHFMPDIIIGVNLTDSVLPPDEDDVFSQLKSMVMFKTDLSLMCNNAVLIEPEVNIGSFDFTGCEQAILSGYNAANEMMDSIKMLIERRVSPAFMTNRRAEFKKDFAQPLFESVEVIGVSVNKGKYLSNAIIRKDEIIDLSELKKRYFRLLSDEKIKVIFPLAKLNPTTGNYKLLLDIREEKPFEVKFGGIFSSRPINTGYIGVDYHNLGKIGYKLSAESYFGKFYGSVKLTSKVEFNTKIPFYVEPFGVINRWDYFRSFATFFEDVKPSYIVQLERFLGADIGLPLGNSGKLVSNVSYGEMVDSYYQTEAFTAADTADQTKIIPLVVGMFYEKSTLDKKWFPRSGFFLRLESKYIEATEGTVPGSTSPFVTPIENVNHKWFYFKVRAEKYFQISDYFSWGGELESVIQYYLENNFYENYTATVIQSPSYQPLMETRTFFTEQHVSHEYLGMGVKVIFKPASYVEFRAESYLFQPYTKIAKNDLNQAYYAANYIKNVVPMASGSFIYHSPLGPLSGSINYLVARENKWSFTFNFGYLIANRRLVR